VNEMESQESNGCSPMLSVRVSLGRQGTQASGGTNSFRLDNKRVGWHETEENELFACTASRVETRKFCSVQS